MSIHARRRVLIGRALLSVTVLLSCLALQVHADIAGAELSPVAQPGAGHVTADALPTVQINGVVWDQAIVGNTVYVVGEFTRARPAGAPLGSNETVRNNMLAYNLTTGVLLPNFVANLNAPAKTVTAAPDGSRIYIGGNFTQVNTLTRNRIAALDPSTGTPVNGFSASLDYRVNDIVATASTVYVGGQFNYGPGNQPRTRLAAFAASNGALTSWAPTADNEVHAIVMAPDGSRLFAGGKFQNVNGAPAYGLAAIDSTTGALMPWAETTGVRNAQSSSAILTLKTDGTSITGSGYTFSRNTGNLEGVFSADPQTGVLNWVEDCHGDTYDHAHANGYVYTVSHAHYCASVGGFPQTDPWSVNMQHAVSFTNRPTGTVGREPWGYHNWEGRPSPSMVNWFPQLEVGSFTGQTQAAWDVEANSQYVVLGGEFPRVNNSGQQGLVRFAVRSIAPRDEGPILSEASFPVKVQSTTAGQARVTFAANWDPDDANLNYRITRNGATVDQRTVASTFWNRPVIGFTDTGLAPGVAYTYRVIVTDGDANSAQSSQVGVTITSANAPSPYADAVLADGARFHWRLDEASVGLTPDELGPTSLAINTGASIGGPSALLNEAGSSGTFTNAGTARMYDQTRRATLDPVTVEAWVRTSSSTGGRIFGFGNNATSNSTTGDRVLYMANNGRILFGARQTNSGNGPGLGTTRQTVESPAGFNNGQWHHVVGTLGQDGMHLYVDGVRVASRGDVRQGSAYQGYWRVGADSLASWPNRPSTDNLTGNVDEAAIYYSVLSAKQIAGHYAASGRTPALPPAPGDAYGSLVRNADPYLYYRLAEPSGSTATDSGIRANTGDVIGTVSRNAVGAITGNNATQFGSGFVASRTQVYNPTNYAVETWFNTTTISGGQLIGFGNSRTTNSTTSDRQVAMRNDGRLVYRVRAGVDLVSTQPYNDGQWHHVVATQGPSGTTLYVDGSAVDTSPVVLSGAYSGYWRVGGDSTGGQSTSANFNGRLDEAAVYDRPLNQADVLAHLALGGGEVGNLAPDAAFDVDVDFLSISVDGVDSSDLDGTIESYQWDFGDGDTATGIEADHGYDLPGTYQVKLTVTDDDGATGTLTKPVTVSAAPSNQAPEAEFSSTTAGLTANLNGGPSDDPDGTIVSYAWNFGDGDIGADESTSHPYEAAGTYTVTLTVTDDDGATDSVSHDVTVSAVTVLAADTFERTVTGGFGSTTPGGAWTVAGGDPMFAVNGGQGRMTMSAPGASRTASLGISGLDVDSRVDLALDKSPTGGGTFFGSVLRKNGNTEYRARLVARTTSSSLQILRVTAGVEATVATVTLPGVLYTGGTTMHLRFRATGSGTTTLSAKAWFGSAAEPGTWQVQGTDTTAALQVAGGVGVQAYISGTATNTPVVMLVDNLSVQVAQ